MKHVWQQIQLFIVVVFLYLNYASNTTMLCSKRIRKLRPLNTIYYSRWYQIYIYRQTPLRFDSTVTKTFCNPPWACKHTFKLAFVFCHRLSRENIRSNQLSQVLYPRASHYIKRSLFISCLGRWMLVLFSFENPNGIMCWYK